MRNPWATRGWPLTKKLAHYSNRSAGPDACWPWIGRTMKAGYGCLNWKGREYLAHRLAWQCAHGPIPGGLKILHRCDNPPCVNPAHLFVGTQADNVADMMAKGRNRPLFGETNGIATLTPDAVLAIRADARPQKEIAAQFGVTQAHVSALKLRKCWAHLEPRSGERGRP